eukprot:GHVR01016296.1.p1 GENE.GHVR01016296.1~~GHVR01016296.1.p1  ORF type:complete len:489 (+),score=101.09 GHVR01016296.1:50-1516(+)
MLTPLIRHGLLSSLPQAYTRYTSVASIGRSFSSYSDTCTQIIMDKIENNSKERISKYKYLKKEHGDLVVDSVTVGRLLGGLRGLQCLICETSDLDINQGIRYRSIGVKEACETLPCAPGGVEPLPEGLIYLLLTGEFPTNDDINIIQEILRSKQDVPPHILRVLDSLPPHTHPMTQLITAITALQTESRFAVEYNSGSLRRNEYWKGVLDDSMSVMAKIPVVAAYIYRRSFTTEGNYIPPTNNTNVDWTANFCMMMGFEETEFVEFMRLYMTLHADHEGGNVSTHAARLVGSTLSDPYLCISSGLCGLSGPLHGLANQECLKWILQTHSKLNGAEPTPEKMAEIAKATVAAGQVIPGFGHAVLRKTDPRYLAQREFAQKVMPNDPLFKIVDACFKGIPPTLMATGRVRNPYPNVDAHSGIILHKFNLREPSFYTVLFGVSRAIGLVCQLVWDRLLQLPIERPKSITIDRIINDITHTQTQQNKNITIS